MQKSRQDNEHSISNESKFYDNFSTIIMLYSHQRKLKKSYMMILDDKQIKTRHPNQIIRISNRFSDIFKFTPT